MGRIALGGFLAASSIFLGSCEQYLDIDKYVYDQTTLDSIFLSRSRTEEYINGAAALLFDESQMTGSEWGAPSCLPSGLGSDEAIIPYVLNSNAILYDEVKETSTRFNPWPQCYKGIRKANILLQNISRNKDLTDGERNDFMGRAYFLRAYFYFYLVRMYGPVVILPETPFDTDESVANASLERSTYDKCVEQICSDFDKAAELLPRDRIEAHQYLPTKGAAMSLKARTQLYAASPLFNGNTYYSDWKTSTGENFISQTEDLSKWGKAAASFKQVIDLNKYQLNTVAKIDNSKGTGTLPLPSTVSSANFPNGAGDIDPYKSYKTLFDGTYQPYTVPEYIYYCPNQGDGDYRLVMPNKLGGNATLSVTLDMIDEYRMADGRPFSEATELEKSGAAVGIDQTFSLDYLLSSSRAYRDDGREPRFYATIGFNACIWPTTSHRDGLNAGTRNYVCDYYFGGSASDLNYKDNHNRTGYTNRKYVHQDDCIFWNGVVKAKTFPIVRYAEVLLGYVEAMNEMNGSYTDEKSGVTVTRDVDEMVKYFNMIRYRAGQPGITTSEASNKETMRKLIKHERQIEFAFEGQRYWDLRRWKDAYDAYNRPVRGLDVSANQAQRDQFYTERIWNTEKCMKRTFSNKMYFWPLDRNVLSKNGKLVQNPGW
ncbi:RagB/SusD family nutrient uptake outer membrane protein [Hallella bergensis]|uniref:RagB/SusD family nutrient uptake outer membrane protein n=1 Tax=Hallella bergensis TaxID=242750 RepID=UPI00399079E3